MYSPISKPNRLEGKARLSITRKDKTLTIMDYTSVVFYACWVKISYNWEAWWIPAADILDIREHEQYQCPDESVEKS